MQWPDEVLDRLHRRFRADYPAWARGKGSWPLRISLQPPSTTERSAAPVECHEWAARWAAHPVPGTLEYTNLRFPTGTHLMPKTLILQRPGDVATAHSDDHQTWQRCGQRLTALQREFPDARFTGLIRRITELGQRDYDRLIRTVGWLRVNPTSGLLLRQLPIEGIDTKWIAAHANLVLALLGDEPSPEPSDNEAPQSRKRGLHTRLGLRVVPELVQVTVCDQQLRSQLAGMRHLAAPVDDLNRWPLHPTTVVILENKETAFAVEDDHLGTVILHGHGFFVEQYARITWVRDAQRIIYWGDIDLPGLQFVSDLRGYGIPATTILTDTTVLERYRHLSTEGALPQRNSVPSRLTDTERQLYEHLVEYATEHGAGLLLEQERIPWDSAYPQLMSELRQEVCRPERTPHPD
ncbi:DUF3322 and DUF2220 domain-containing protein [Nocardia brasiliensis]|uniref:DUF3322 and DUF2220 domain-containing protein n=1 Tax=Nocardia brasiliensis TaxID=37326 RepID=UPI002458E307|nr:DUF3322 and DUF2220 domain-containing protein [Nocardia brasiliensis]